MIEKKEIKDKRIVNIPNQTKECGDRKKVLCAFAVWTNFWSKTKKASTDIKCSF